MENCYNLVTAADADALAAIHHACFDNGWAAADIIALLPTCIGIKSQHGFVLCQCAAGQADIVTIAVHPLYQQQGIGHSLLKLLLFYLQQQGCDKIFLEVAAGNQPAVKLYKKIGFIFNGKRCNYYNNGDDALTGYYTFI